MSCYILPEFVTVCETLFYLIPLGSPIHSIFYTSLFYSIRSYDVHSVLHGPFWSALHEKITFGTGYLAWHCISLH